MGFGQCVHVSFRARQSGIGVSVGEVVRNSAFRTPHVKWSPRLVSRQRLLLFREALICLSYSGKWSSRAVTLRRSLLAYQPGALLLSYGTDNGFADGTHRARQDHHRRMLLTFRSTLTLGCRVTCANRCETVRHRHRPASESAGAAVSAASEGLADPSCEVLGFCGAGFCNLLRSHCGMYWAMVILVSCG